MQEVSQLRRLGFLVPFCILTIAVAAVAQWVELVVGRLLVRIPAPRGGTELHVEVSLSKILNPKIAPDVQLAPWGAASAISKGPAMSWQLNQGEPWIAFTHPVTGFGPSNPATPLKKGR